MVSRKRREEQALYNVPVTKKHHKQAAATEPSHLGLSGGSGLYSIRAGTVGMALGPSTCRLSARGSLASNNAVVATASGVTGITVVSYTQC